jgi:hypothetical protein
LTCRDLDPRTSVVVDTSVVVRIVVDLSLVRAAALVRAIVAIKPRSPSLSIVMRRDDDGKRRNCLWYTSIILSTGIALSLLVIVMPPSPSHSWEVYADSNKGGWQQRSTHDFLERLGISHAPLASSPPSTLFDLRREQSVRSLRAL